MVEQKKSTKKISDAEISIEKAILAHKFTCPYYSIRGVIKARATNDERLPSQEVGHCGAEPLWEQTKGESQCTGKCWYISHFMGLLKELV